MDWSARSSQEQGFRLLAAKERTEEKSQEEARKLGFVTSRRRGDNLSRGLREKSAFVGTSSGSGSGGGGGGDPLDPRSAASGVRTLWLNR
jgi:hypothetical protein